MGIPHSRKPPLIAVDVAMAAMAPLGAQVIDSADLEADHALMDSGMDSLSGAAPTAKIWGNYSYSYWVVTYVVQKKSYVYIYIFIHIHIHIDININIHIHIHIHIDININIHIHIHMPIHIPINIYLYLYLYIYIYIHIHIHIHICMYICISILPSIGSLYHVLFTR